jgi:hypothetical protein
MALPYRTLSKWSPERKNNCLDEAMAFLKTAADKNYNKAKLSFPLFALKQGQYFGIERGYIMTPNPP